MTTEQYNGGPSDDEIRRLVNLPFNQDENGTEWVTLTPGMLARAVRRVLATTEPVMANGLTEAETDASASVVGLATTEPAVNQQLTTELDEREAFEKWAAPNRFDVGHKGEDGSYLGRATSIAWAGWQARAAMAEGVK